MFLSSQPDEDQIHDFWVSQQGSPFSYPTPGATREDLPDDYRIDYTRIHLGWGSETFLRSAEALRSFAVYPRHWIRLYPELPQIRTGSEYCVVVSHYGFWSINPVRIVYELDERGPIHRYGFACGTLMEHALCGEERFLVEWRDDDSVWFDLLAFSKPVHPLARYAYPIVRRLQRRFASESKKAMLRAVAAEAMRQPEPAQTRSRME